MNAKNTAKLLPIISDEEKLEVSLEGDKAIIKLSSWTEDLGWCGQKTLRVDLDMLDDLHRAIAAARARVNRQKDPEIPVSNKVLAFPAFS